MSRRTFAHKAALAAVTVPIAAARTDDPELARLAAEFSAALDRLERLWPIYEDLTDGTHGYGEIESFEDSEWGPAASEMRAAEGDLFDGLRARGLTGVVARGRIFLGPGLLCWDQDCDYPEKVAAANLSRLAVV